MFGGGARPRFFHTIDSSNSGGTFTFANLSAYAAGKPELFTMNQGNIQASFSQNEYFSFFQDEIQVRPSLSVSLGIRYERQSNLDDHNNFAPRLAFAYAPRRGQIVLRGGFGIFYDLSLGRLHHGAGNKALPHAKHQCATAGNRCNSGPKFHQHRPV